MALSTVLDPFTIKTIRPLLPKTDKILCEKSIEDLSKLKNEGIGVHGNDFGPKKEDAIIDWYYKNLLGAEGNTQNLYLDTNGYVTVGKGHKIDGNNSSTLEAKINELKSRGFPFYTCAKTPDQSKRFQYASSTANEQEAQPIDINKSVQFLLKKRELGLYGKPYPASYYYDPENNPLYMKENDITRLAKNDIKEKIAHLKAKDCFPDILHYPIGAQEALLDMSFNLGASGIVNKFRNFTAWIKGPRGNPMDKRISYPSDPSAYPNWNEVAFGIDPTTNKTYYSRKDVGESRNTATKILFILAEAAARSLANRG